MGRERKYVGPQGFWQEGRFSVFVTYIGQTSRGFNGLTGINIPLPPPSCGSMLVVPMRCRMPRWGKVIGFMGEAGIMQRLSTQGSQIFVWRWQQDSTLDGEVTWALHPHATYYLVDLYSHTTYPRDISDHRQHGVRRPSKRWLGAWWRHDGRLETWDCQA